MEFYFERLDIDGGGRFRLPKGTVSIGRSPKSTITLPAQDKGVSGIHAVIYADQRRLLLQDMQSTNGTYVNGRQVQECVLEEGDEVRLGLNGPRFKVTSSGVAEYGGGDTGGLNYAVPALTPVSIGDGGIDIDSSDYGGFNGNDDSCLDNGAGFADDYDYGNEPVNSGNSHRTSRFPLPILAIGITAAIALFAVAGLLLVPRVMLSSGNSKTQSAKQGFFKLHESGSTADASTNIGAHTDTNIATSASKNAVAMANINTVDHINSVLASFGETDYRAPPEMVERVEHYLALYTGRNRQTFATYMRRGRQYFPMINSILAENKLPTELAYVAMLESGFNPTAVSHAGAGGLWQFMPATARRYGLEVSDHIDERTDPIKATHAAAAYFKHLIAIFGARSSVMLSIAAYNAGEQRIINALKRIDDPMKNRDFWYIYRNGWLAEETNEYIPQIITFMILSNNLHEYGFTEF